MNYLEKIRGDAGICFLHFKKLKYNILVCQKHATADVAIFEFTFSFRDELLTCYKYTGKNNNKISITNFYSVKSVLVGVQMQENENRDITSMHRSQKRKYYTCTNEVPLGGSPKIQKRCILMPNIRF